MPLFDGPIEAGGGIIVEKATPKAENLPVPKRDWLSPGARKALGVVGKIFFWAFILALAVAGIMAGWFVWAISQ